MNDITEVLDTVAKSYGLAFAVTLFALVVVWREWRKNDAEKWEALKELTDIVKEALRDD